MIILFVFRFRSFRGDTSSQTSQVGGRYAIILTFFRPKGNTCLSEHFSLECLKHERHISIKEHSGGARLYWRITFICFLGGVGWRSFYLHEKTPWTACPSCWLSTVSATSKTWWCHWLRLRVFWCLFYCCAICTLVCTLVSKSCAAFLFAIGMFYVLSVLNAFQANIHFRTILYSSLNEFEGNYFLSSCYWLQCSVTTKKTMNFFKCISQQSSPFLTILFFAAYL